jgi:hypothetical protein
MIERRKTYQNLSSAGLGRQCPLTPGRDFWHNHGGRQRIAALRRHADVVI